MDEEYYIFRRIYIVVSYDENRDIKSKSSMYLIKFKNYRMDS